MARRYHEIKGLAEFTAKTIVSDEEQWKKFLHTAGHMYKYPFREQMLIYAQRPDATACASLELWNEKMNCWVNKGAQGIALIDEEGVHRSGLKYVFDVKDVHEARFIGHKPKLWKMEEEHKDYVIDSLERIYGETDAESDLDVVVSYSGSEREDDLFNTLNDEHMYFGKVELDINPINAAETGTLAQYLPGVEKHLEEKSEKIELDKIVAFPEKKESKQVVTFTVAESSEFHSFGELHEGIPTLQDAIKDLERS